MKPTHSHSDAATNTARPAPGGSLNQNQHSFHHEKHQPPAPPRVSHNIVTESIVRNATMPTQDEIENRAYEIFVEQGCCHGNDLGHWYQAESELAARRNQPTAVPASV